MSPFLKSPMPGTVVSVAVNVGDTVRYALKIHIMKFLDSSSRNLPASSSARGPKSSLRDKSTRTFLPLLLHGRPKNC